MNKKEITRFQKRIELDLLEGCWLWKGGSKGKTGYGSFWFKGKSGTAHQASYDHWNGKVPQGLQIDHLCRNRKCVNPAHLYLGTQKDNLADAVKIGRIGIFGEKNGAAKLRVSDIPIIRKSAQDGCVHKIIAERFGVCRQTIDQIIRGETWQGHASQPDGFGPRGIRLSCTCQQPEQAGTLGTG